MNAEPKPDSMLASVASTMRLTNHLREINDALFLVSQGFTFRVAIAAVSIHLSARGEAEIAGRYGAIVDDLERQKREIEDELSWRSRK